ncbi:MAG: hypothetical protein ACR2GA_01870 [Chloroflexota bacterium]
MYTLIVRGPRRAVLAVHRCATTAEVRELLAVYAALGHKPEMLQVEERPTDQAA